MKPTPRLIVGLGNPGTSYDRTRHSVGRRYIDFLADQSGQTFRETRQAEHFRLPDFFGVPVLKPIVAAKLTCYMNESGPAVQAAAAKHAVPASEILVILDDFMIPFGSLRLKESGSAGGHNGLQSIIDVFGAEVSRLRVGIGPVPAGVDPADFVLQPFLKNEQEKLPAVYQAITENLKVLFGSGYQKGMSSANRAHLEP